MCAQGGLMVVSEDRFRQKASSQVGRREKDRKIMTAYRMACGNAVISNGRELWFK